MQPIVRNIPEFWEGRAPPHGAEPGPTMFGFIFTDYLSVLQRNIVYLAFGCLLLGVMQLTEEAL